MAQRQNVNRVETPEVQGEGSFVELRALSWGKNKEFQKGLAAANGGVLPRRESDVLAVTDAFIEANDELTNQMICESVVRWNWVDDNGNDLPLPKDGGIAALSMAEIAYLMRKLQEAPNPKG